MEVGTIIELGEFAEQVLCDPRFHTICDKFNEQTIASMLATKPADKEKREGIYAAHVGYGEFIAFLQQLNSSAHKLQEPTRDHSDDQDVLDPFRE